LTVNIVAIFIKAEGALRRWWMVVDVARTNLRFWAFLGFTVPMDQDAYE
jgi:hypothetical protein